MAGLGAFLLAGFLGGAGEALQNAAKERKERAAERAKARRAQLEQEERQRRDSEIYREIHAPTAERGRENLGELTPLWGQVNTGGEKLSFGDTVTPAEGAQAAPGDDTFVSGQQRPPRMGFGEVLNMSPVPTGALPNNARPTQEQAAMVTQAAEAEGVDPNLFMRLVAQESGFRANARSPKDAFGYAQLMPGTADALGVDRTDPMQNLRGGARYLRQQLDKFGDPALALAAYNAGPGRVVQYNGIPPFEETQNYVEVILSGYQPGSPMGEVTSGAVSLSAPPAQPGAPDAARIERLIFMATDPNASSEARAAAKKELERISPASTGASSPDASPAPDGSIPAPGASKLASEIWMDNGDGTETLYGRVSGSNTLEPYLKDGKPVSRSRDEADKGSREADWQLGSGQMQAIQENMEADAEADRWDNPPTISAMRLEVERLMKADGTLTLSQAYDLAAKAWGGDDTTVEVPDPGLFNRDRTRTQEAPVYAFRYEDDALKPRATDPGVAEVLRTPATPGPYRAAPPPIRPERLGLGQLTGRTGDLRGLAGGTQTTAPAAPVMPTAPVPTTPGVTGPDRRVTATPEFASAIQSIPNEATPARDTKFVEMARAGYTSPLSTTMAPVRLTEGLPQGMASIEFRVGVMPVAFGDGRQDIVMPASYNLGKSVVEQMGGFLPTRGIVDAMYAQGNRVIVQPQGASPEMTSMAVAARHTKAVYDKLPGDTSKPVVGPFKEILADGHYYGLWKRDGTPWQPYTDLSRSHDYSYADYSQAARMVAPTAIVTYADGRRVEVNTQTLYNTPALRGVLGLKG